MKTGYAYTCYPDALAEEESLDVAPSFRDDLYESLFELSSGRIDLLRKATDAFREIAASAPASD